MLHQFFKSLPLVTFLYKLQTIMFHSRSKVAGLMYLSCQSPVSSMIFAHAFMHFLYDYLDAPFIHTF